MTDSKLISWIIQTFAGTILGMALLILFVAASANIGIGTGLLYGTMLLAVFIIGAPVYFLSRFKVFVAALLVSGIVSPLLYYLMIKL